MNKPGLQKWLQRDIKRTTTLEIPSVGIELELEALDWNRTQNLLKKNTIPVKGGPEKRDTSGYTMDLVASSIKKVNGEPFNLYDRETLKEIGVQDHVQAINKLFTVKEIQQILRISNELSGDSEEAEEQEIEELKN